MLIRLGFIPYIHLSLRIWRTSEGAHIIVHLWLFKLGMHFGASARD